MCWYCWGQSFKICMSIFSTLNHAYKILVKMYVYFVSKCINFAIHFKIIVVGFIGNYFLFIHSYYQVHAKIILWGCLLSSNTCWVSYRGCVSNTWQGVKSFVLIEVRGHVLEVKYGVLFF